MTSIRGPLAHLDSSREELAKAWLVRLIERASLEEIRDLPTDQITLEVPELISDIVRWAADTNGGPYQLSEEQTKRAASLARLRTGGRDARAADLARDVTALQAVLVEALKEEVLEHHPESFAETVEQLLEATGAVQAAAVEELVRARSRVLESQANTDALTGLGNLRHLRRQLAHLVDLHKRYGHPFGLLLMDVDDLKRINDAHGHQAGDRVLMQVAMSVRRSVRSVDIAARLGGDERRRAGGAARSRGRGGGGDAGRSPGEHLDRGRVLPGARRGLRSPDRPRRPRDVQGKGGGRAGGGRRAAECRGGRRRS